MSSLQEARAAVIAYGIIQKRRVCFLKASIVGESKVSLGPDIFFSAAPSTVCSYRVSRM